MQNKTSQMRHSELKQRVFDDMFNALALLVLLSNDEIEEIAEGLEDPESCAIECEPMFRAVASAVRMAKE